MREDKALFHDDGCDYRIDHEGRCVGCDRTGIDAQSTQLARQCEAAHPGTATRCQRPHRHDGFHSASIHNSLQSWQTGPVGRDLHHSQGTAVSEILAAAASGEKECGDRRPDSSKTCALPAGHPGRHANDWDRWDSVGVDPRKDPVAESRGHTPLAGSLKAVKTPSELWADAERDQRSYPRGDFKTTEQRFVSYMVTHGHLPAPEGALLDQLAEAWAKWVSARDHGDVLAKKMSLASVIDAAANLQSKL